MKLVVPKAGMLGEIKRIYQKLHSISNSLEKIFTATDITEYSIEIANLHHQLLEIQFNLRDVKTLMTIENHAEYQRYIDLTFSKIYILSDKLEIAKKTLRKLAKEEKINSFKDALHVDSDDLLK